MSLAGARIGSMFSGIGGLELGLERAGIGTVAWQAEIDLNASEVLAKHWPGSRNLGDVSQVEWADEHRVDVLCAGFPCQPVSDAGRRKGTEDDRWLWPEVARALAALRPRHLVAENVPGLITVNGGAAFRQVISDLHGLGYEVAWGIRAAASVGACHRRKRLFIWATSSAIPPVGTPVGTVSDGRVVLAQASLFEEKPLGLPRAGALTGGHVYELPASPWGGEDKERWLLPTPVASNFNDGEEFDGYVARRRELAANYPNGNGCGVPLGMIVRLLPTPTSSNLHDGEDVEAHLARQNAHKESGEGSRPWGVTLDMVARLLPTPLVADARNSRQSTVPSPRAPHPVLPDVVRSGTWDDYLPAMERWAEVFGEPWPAPTVATSRGDRLSADFVRWMMGFEPGWVEGMSRAVMLRLFGNAVVPQVAEVIGRAVVAEATREDRDGE